MHFAGKTNTQHGKGRKMKKKVIKKFVSAALTLSLAVGMTCFAGYGDSYAYGATAWDAANGESLEDAMAEANVNHTKLQTKANAFKGIEKKINTNTAKSAKISKSEINSLLANSNGKKTLKYKEAVSDVNLYFKALKYRYGAYEYFGGDKRFNKAKQEVLKNLKGKKTVSRANLTKYLQNAMKFIIDGHFSIEGLVNSETDSVAYQYYYDYSHKFNKDENGYYKTENGEKWYYKSCSTKSVTLEKTLTTSGDIVYSPVQFCTKTKSAKTSTITLVNGKKTKKETVKWKKQKSFNATMPCSEPDFNYLNENGIAYISVRNFSPNYESELSKFAETGTPSRNAKMIIFDIRSNGGGSDQYAKQWVKNFTGDEAKVNSIYGGHETALDNGTYGKEASDIFTQNGVMLNNNVPIIVLVDDKCGSAGEFMLLALRSMDNVIVVGGNSYGAQICGNTQWYRLPKSGIGFNFGNSLEFAYNKNLIDDKGYKPDVWCNPGNALEAVTKMLEKQDYISDGIGKTFRDKIGDTYTSVAIEFVGNFVMRNDGFGRIVSEQLNVVCNGNAIKDYTVESGDPSKITAERLSNGKLSLQAKEADRRIPITITYKGKSYIFFANS